MALPPLNYNYLNQRQKKQVREEYILDQGGKCYHCGKTLSKPPTGPAAMLPINESLFPPGFFNNPVHLHHDHNTGMTIGAVHARCNAVLWQYHKE